jgi:tRNA (guanine37-N1)-methyltransferase
MRFDILTIFPNFFGAPTEKSIDGQGIFGSGMLRRALIAGHVAAQVHDLRAFATDKHRTVDGRPFGGGEGMLLKPEPFAHALESLSVTPKTERTAAGSAGRETVILLSAQGEPFTQAVAQELASCHRIVLLCGRYEGVDERVAELLADREISVGDYVLTGGELGAAVIVDAVTRLVPGVLGNPASSAFESFGAPDAQLTPSDRSAQTPPPATHGAGGLLDYPQYTRPAVFDGAAVPAVLTEGNHEQVRSWRRERSLEKTLRNRPDLLANAELSDEDRAFLERLRRA